MLKTALTTPPILKYPCLNKEFILNTDASGTAIGAILTQKYDGIEHPVCYASRTLNSAERRYSTIERELLAVVWVVKKYRIYLTGVHFTIVTDHRPLKYLLTIKDPSSRLAKWAMFLMEYSFTIEYKPGRMHTNVDTLSRIKTEEEPNKEVIAMIQHEVKEKPLISVIWSKSELAELQQKDAEIRDIVDNKLETSEHFYLSSENILYRKRIADERSDQIVAPTSLKGDIFNIYHTSVFSAHPGQQKTLQNIKKDFYWYNMKKDVKKFCEECHSCNLRKTNYQPPAELQKTPVPDAVFSFISLDIVGPLNQTSQNNKYLLTCVDFLTRYPECIPLPDITAKTVARAFVEHIILRFGTPRQLLTDCGSQFVSKLFKEICKLLDITKLKTTPYHPQSNGIIERMHKTLKTMLSHYMTDYEQDWDKFLPYALMAYRNQQHNATNEIPFFLMFGRDMELPFHLSLRDNRTRYDIDENYISELTLRLQIDHEKAKKSIQDTIDKRSENFNQKKTRTEFRLGDKVYLHSPVVRNKDITRKLQPKWRGPYRIIEKKGPVTFKIREINGRKEEMVHANRLKICKGELEPELQRDDLAIDVDTSDANRSQEQLDVSIIYPVQPTVRRRNEDKHVILSDSEESTSSVVDQRADHSDSEDSIADNDKSNQENEEINEEETNNQHNATDQEENNEINQETLNEAAGGSNPIDSTPVGTTGRPRRNIRQPKRLDDFFLMFKRKN